MKIDKLPVLYSMLLAMVCGFTPWQTSLGLPALDLNTQPIGPDYSKPEGWLVKPVTPSEAIDVFFVYPTVLFNDTDWIMDTRAPSDRDAAMEMVKTQASVFTGKANIYAPMYRQLNLSALTMDDTLIAPLHALSHNDVWRALTYYLKYENKGRPFFLAGHSQGSLILTDLLLEHWGSTGAENRFVAALLIGWSLTPDELKTNSFVRMCESSSQTGCVISYNTMAKGLQSLSPTLKKNALAVNPLSWSIDGAFIPAEKNIGATFFDKDGTVKTYPHFTSAQIVDGALIVQPTSLDLVTVKGGHFPEGVYHAFDYNLFYENLKENILERIDAFGKKPCGEKEKN